MGHFSYTCHLSGIPITEGDKAVLLPILPKAHWGYDNSQKNLEKFGKSNLCSNDGPNMYFDEVFFPIFGEYDSYGGLEGIEKDDNTSVLEEYFGLPIEKIVAVLNDGRKNEFEGGGQFCDSVKILDKTNEKHMRLLGVSTTWYRREFYDSISKLKNNDWEDKLDLGTPGILLALGFNYIGLDKSKKRYNQVYEKGGLKLYSDSTWLHVSEKDAIYNISGLKKYCAKYGVEIDSRITSGSKFSQLYDFVLPHINSVKEFSQNRDLTFMLLGDERSVKTSMYDMAERLVDSGNMSYADARAIMDKEDIELAKTNLTIFYFKKIKENGGEFLKKNIVDWFNVKQYYYPTGRFLYPVGTSAQDGDHSKVKKLLETALSVINEDLKEREEYADEEEDED